MSHAALRRRAVPQFLGRIFFSRHLGREGSLARRPPRHHGHDDRRRLRVLERGRRPGRPAAGRPVAGRVVPRPGQLELRPDAQHPLDVQPVAPGRDQLARHRPHLRARLRVELVQPHRERGRLRAGESTQLIQLILRLKSCERIC